MFLPEKVPNRITHTEFMHLAMSDEECTNRDDRMALSMCVYVGGRLKLTTGSNLASTAADVDIDPVCNR